MGIRMETHDESERFLSALAGVSEPEAKRKIIGREFIRSFEAAQKALVAKLGSGAGTSSSSCRERCIRTSWSPAAAKALPTSRAITTWAGCPMIWSSPSSSRCVRCSRTRYARSGGSWEFRRRSWRASRSPGPGLGIRIIGEVTRERLDILQAADLIVREELTAAGLDEEIWQCPVVLLADVHSVGVQGDGRTYGHPIVLRPVSSEDAMTADWTRMPYDVLARISTRITNSVPEVNRVVLDVTSKPPATIEWE